MKRYQWFKLIFTFTFFINSMTFAILANPIVKVNVDIEYSDLKYSGAFMLELYEKESPNTVRNFVQYVRDQYYANTVFHRIINDFIIQGGGYTTNYKVKPTRRPIVNEAHNQLKNLKYTIAMARTSDIHSATSQFFINLKDNNELNYVNSTRSGYGYVVFGKVFQGRDVIQKIASLPTYADAYHKNLPTHKVVITAMTILKETELTEQIKETLYDSSEE